MAVEDLRKLTTSGWGSQIVMIYETFFLTDLLGYVFPGAVLLLGLERLHTGRLPELDSTNWLTLAFGLSASYSVGIFLRLFGTLTHILVIAPVVGWLGDPWDLKSASNRDFRKGCEKVWKSPHESEIVHLYQSMYAERSDSLASTKRRQTVFLHLAGSLGLAVLVLALVSLAAGVAPYVGLDTIHPLSVHASVFLSLAGIVLITGHYRHARTIRLLDKAAEGK